jgi:hypothetical protein
MNLTIPLDAEETAALAGMVERHNEADKTSLTPTEYLELVCTNLVREEVKKNFDAVANQLVTAAKSLPYEARAALVDELTAKLA